MSRRTFASQPDLQLQVSHVGVALAELLCRPVACSVTRPICRCSLSHQHQTQLNPFFGTEEGELTLSFIVASSAMISMVFCCGICLASSFNMSALIENSFS